MSLRDLPGRTGELSEGDGEAGPHEVLDGRFRIERAIGRGGMAMVYAATELASGRRVALKRMMAPTDPDKRQRHAEFFEHEFHVLSTLRHPRVVEVDHYGIEADGAYYTMELLDGGDLQQLAPLPWRKICSIGRDVCSALSLLHSRRLIHRDVSPRNVRLSPDGTAKLIDFGAVAGFGPRKIVVGTPPCSPPESARMQPLDGRTDLFSLGATLYYALTGRHAYAARNFAQLSEVWLAGVARPSAIVADVPDPLDALLLDLLRLEPDARPANAAEVIERLSAIDGERDLDSLAVAHAYLTMPSLVGRSEASTRVQRKLARTRAGSARTVVIDGASGVGRSRFLDACLLDSMLLGLTTARADAEDAAGGDYATLRALVRQLIRSSPVQVAQTTQPQIALLSQALPELLELCEPRALPDDWDPLRLRPELQRACVGWFDALSRLSPLILGVDDYHRCDEPSAAMISLLAQEQLGYLSLLVSVETGATSVSTRAQQMLVDTATVVSLTNLSDADSEQLLCESFGDPPGIRTFASRLREIAGGNPRDLIRLAQHLIDRGVLRYEAGAWAVPLRVDETDLPSSMADTLRARVNALPSDARMLAIALTLCPDQDFSVAECALLTDRPVSRRVIEDLETLIAAEVVRGIDVQADTPRQMALSKPAWIAPLRATATPELERVLHARLARVFEARGLGFRAGRHWLLAAESDRALDVLVEHSRLSQAETAKSALVFLRYARELPADWFDTFREALRLCETLARPRRDAFFLRARLAGIVAAYATPDPFEVATLLRELEHDAGLDEVAELPAELDPVSRARLALSRATARYEALPDRERTLPPHEALAVLARTVGAYTGRAHAALDPNVLTAVPNLAPFAPVFPAFGLLDSLLAGIRARYAGRPERARAIYREVIEQLERPDHGGLDGSYARTIRSSLLTALGTMDACMGLQSSLDWARLLGPLPEQQINVQQVQLVYHLYRGDVRAADTCKAQIERLRLQSQQLHESSLAVWELGAHAIAEDLTRLRHHIEQFAPLAQHYTGWKAARAYASAEYQRIRRDLPRALEAIDEALSIATPGNHPLWANMAAAHVHILRDLGRSNEALTLAHQYATAARHAELAVVAEPVQLALAQCQAQTDDGAAEARTDAVIERLQALGVRGLLLGSAFEARAKVALARDDADGFAHHLELALQAYDCERHPALLAKLKRLRQDAEGRGAAVPKVLNAPEPYSSYTGIRIVTALEFCRGVEQRARLALTILARQSGANAGHLFTFSGETLEHAATVGPLPLAPSLLRWASDYVALHADDSITTSSRSDEDEAPIECRDSQGRRYQPILLSHNTPSGLAITGIALLAADGAPLINPAQVASAISRFWARYADSSMLVLRE